MKSGSRKNLLVLKSSMNNSTIPSTKAFFYFLEWALPNFVLLNKYFLTEKVVLDQLHEKMTQIYKDILLCFLKRDYVMRTPLAEIDLKDETKMLDAKNLYLGTV